MEETLVKDLRSALESAANFRKPEPERRFHKDDQYLSYGLRASLFRKILKDFKQRFLNLKLQERLQLAGQLLAEHIGELGHVGIHVIALSVDELEPYHFRYFERLLDDFRSWSHVDHLCLEVMRHLLRKYPEATLLLLREWNRSPNYWKRRASVVTFTREVGESGEYTDEVLQLCDNLIWDPEDLVQKGVGWALKDNLRAAPEKVIPYVKDLRRKGVPATITLYAIRDLKGEKRKEILAVRKNPNG